MENLTSGSAASDRHSLNLEAPHSSVQLNTLVLVATPANVTWLDTVSHYAYARPQSDTNTRSSARRQLTYLDDHTNSIKNCEDFVHVPGVAAKVYIPRQILLAEIASSLGLTIYSTGSVNEDNSKLRAFIEIDIPTDDIEMIVTKKTFYSELMETPYTAMESAANAAITCLMKGKNVEIDDANYNRLSLLEKKIEAAKCFEDAYKITQQQNTTYITSFKKCATDVLDQIKEICYEVTNFLPLDISESIGSAKDSKYPLFRYIGAIPPTTSRQRLAIKLANLASMSITAPAAMFHMHHES